MDDRRKAIDEKKSDGTSSLYITRDIAAALNRREKFGFEKMIYVADNTQGHHFQNLFRILSRLGWGWSQKCHHVKFHKILGISSAPGGVTWFTSVT
jgi:arginyl-tRNA synthetase